MMSEKSMMKSMKLMLLKMYWVRRCSCGGNRVSVHSGSAGSVLGSTSWDGAVREDMMSAENEGDPKAV